MQETTPNRPIITVTFNEGVDVSIAQNDDEAVPLALLLLDYGNHADAFQVEESILLESQVSLRLRLAPDNRTLLAGQTITARLWGVDGTAWQYSWVI